MIVGCYLLEWKTETTGSNTLDAWMGRRINLRATPSAAGPFWLLGVAIWGLGAFFLALWGTFCHLGSTPGDGRFWHLGTSLGPWEQQDGHEVVRNMICIDLGVILDPCILAFGLQEA